MRIIPILLLLFFSTVAIDLHGQCTGEPIVSFNLTSTVVPSCNGSLDGEITVTLDGGEAPFSYFLVLVDGSGNTPIDDKQNTSDQSVTFSGLFSNSGLGSYKVTVVTSNNTTGVPPLLLCTTREVSNIDLPQPDLLEIAADITDECTGENSGEIILNISGGTPPYKIQWTGPTIIPDDEVNPTGLSPGTYQATVTDSEGCTLTETLEVEPRPEATISATGPTTICFGQTTTLQVVINNGTGPYTVVIDTTGANTLRTINNYNVGDNIIIAPTVDATYSLVSVTDSEGCSASVAGSEPIIVISLPTANAGSDEEICSTDMLDLAASDVVPSATNFSSLSWISSGDGTFGDPSALTPIYTPGATDISTGSVTLTLTANGNGPCDPTSDAMVLTLTPGPTADAGSDEAICQGDILDLSTSTTLPSAADFNSLSWSSSGDGAFDDPSALTPIYTPGAADISAGSVSLTLTANGYGSCDPVSDLMVLTLTPPPTTNAGSDEEICSDTQFDLSLSTTTPSATNFSSLSWASSGDGSFDDATSLAPVYTPGAADLVAGTVTLTLTANGNNGCNAFSDDMELTLTAAPKASAGSDEMVCQDDVFDFSTSSTNPTASNFNDLLWSSSGDGSFDNQSVLTPIYTPGPGDITNGSVVLTLTANGNGECLPASSTMTLTLFPLPTASAGSDEAVCQDDSHDFSTSTSIPEAANFSSLAWSSSGDGSFDDAARLTPVYTPGAADIAAGSVILTLTANGNAGCDPVSNAMTLAITTNPTANAGSDETICQGADFDLGTSTTLPSATNFSSLSWSSSGDGTFSDPSTLTPIYTPGATDISTGSVTLTLTANGNGPCDPTSDAMVLTLTPGPTADAGSDEAICQGDIFDLSTSTTLPSAADFNSLSWSSSGDGAFDDPSALTPIYTPGAADISAGSVSLTLTANGYGSCDPVSDLMVLTLTPPPTTNAGSDEEICSDTQFDLSLSTTTPSATNFSSLSWASSGDGSFDDATSLAPVYTPGAADLVAGTVTLTLTANGNNGCNAFSDDMELTLTAAPKASAGSDEMVCQDDVFDFSTSSTNPTASNFNDLLWSSSGDGSFDNQSVLTPIYTPGPGDITNGSVVLTLTANGNGECLPASSTMTLTLFPLPTASAGSDEAVCQDDSHDFSTSTSIPEAANFSSLAWSSSGDGSFDDAARLTPVYTPGAADIAAGSVILTLTANGNAGCDPVSNAMTLAITTNPTANAGSDETICQGADFDLGTSTTLPSATDFSSLSWISSGDGTFGDPSALTPIYTPGATDISTGSVTLTLTANGNGPCDPTSDAMVLTLTPGPTADAGSDEAICQGDIFDLSTSTTLPSAADFNSLSWSSSGDGAFDDPSALTPIYTPGAADISAGSVSLTLTANGYGSCDPVSDLMVLTLTPPPTTNAGSDEEICSDTQFDLSLSTTTPSATNFSSLSWASSGDGSFDDATSLAPVYTPGAADLVAGTVTLTLTANGNNGCNAFSDDMELTLTAAPKASAGSDEMVCQDDVFDFSTSSTNPTASNFNDLLWSSSGDGSFDNQSVLTPIYTPGPGDITNGSVVLTLTANGNGECLPASSTMTLTLFPLPTASAGSDEAVCQDDSHDFSTSTSIPEAANFSSLAWSSSGDGSFDDAARLTPVYTPGAADIAAGSVILTLTANGNAGCDPVSNAMTLAITTNPTANAGSDETICQGADFDLGTSTTLPSATDFSSLSWSSSGDGTFSDPSTLTPIYTPGATDISTGSVTLTLTANGNGPCDPTSDAMVLTLTPGPTADAGSDEAICQGDIFDLSTSTTLPSAADFNSLSWSSSGDGAFDDPSALTPIYTPGAADISAGSVSLTLTASSDGSCANDSDAIMLTITPNPTADAGSDETICQGADFDFSTSASPPNATDFSSLSWISIGDGTFSDPSALKPIYTPGVADISTGSVTLTLTANGNGLCDPASDAMVLTLTPGPTANAGSDEAICQGDDFDLGTSTTLPSAADFSSLSWSSSGDGTFSDPSALTPIYSPGATDISAGSVTLTLTANGSGFCDPTSDAMVLTLTPGPTADAGSDEAICQGDDFDHSTSASLPSAADFSSLSWSSSGDGAFDDPSALTPIYTPGAADISAGSVSLTLTASSDGSCANDSDAMMLTITPNPTADAGSDETICQGADFDFSTSASPPNATDFSSLSWISIGDGTFSDPSTLTPIYTPGATDISTGSVTLTLTANGNGPCDPTSDAMVLTLTPGPTADAGSDEAICQGDIFDLSTSTTLPSAADFNSLSWSSSGDGAFDDPSALTPIYTPGAADISAGSVSLTLTASSDGSCANDSDAIMLTITPNPTADAGSDETICQGADFDFSTSASPPNATDFSSLSWISIGDGTFSDPSALKPIYTPGVADISTGSVTLTLTANGNGLCDPASDAMVLTLTPGPTANAGSDEAICQGDDFDLGTSTTLPSAADFSSLSWSSSGDGTFSDPSTLTPIYAPGATDISAGSVTLTLTANGSGFCDPTSDAMVLTLTPGPTADAGSDEAICQGDDFDHSTSASLPSAADFSSLSWSSSGDGAFDDPSALTPIYTPGAADISAGSVTLTLTANGNGLCPSNSDDMTLGIAPLPTATLSGDASTCPGQEANLTVELTGVAPWTFVYSDGTNNFAEIIASSPFTIPVTPMITTTYSAVSVVDANCTGNVEGTALVQVSPAKEVTINIDEVAEIPGEEVSVPVRLVDFENLMSMQFTVIWDEALLQYDRIANINLGNIGDTSFGLEEVANGKLSFAWSTASFTDTVIVDNTVIFDIVFTIPATVLCSDAPITVDESREIPRPILFTDENLCHANVMVDGGNVDIQATVSISSSDDDNLICFGELVTFTALPGGLANYDFYLNGGIVQSGASNVYVNSSLVDEDLINVIISDAQSCALSANGIVTNVNQINISPDITPISGCGGSDGAIELTITGGSGNYAYLWSGPGIVAGDETNKDQSGLIRGFYQVTVTDNVSSCVESLDIELKEPVSFTLSAEKTDVSTTGGSDGSIDLTITGGTGPFQINWTGPNEFTSTEQDLTDLFAGTYTATVTDLDNGCTDAIVVEITQPISGLVLNATKTDVSTCGAMDGTINLSVEGGSGNYEVSWTGPNGFTSNDQNLTGLGGGQYVATVIDRVTRLTAQWIVVVAEPDGFFLEALATDIVYCNSTDGTINLTVRGGSGDFAYQWRDLSGLGFTSTDEDISDLAQGIYRAVVTDNASGCMDSIDAEVGRPAICELPCGLMVESSTNNTSCPDTEDGAAVINIISGGSGPGNYYVSVDTGKTFIPFLGQDITTIIDRGQGSYLYIVRDTITGCSDTTIANVGISTNLLANVSVSDAGCTEDDGTITFNVSGGLVPFEVEIIDAEGNVTSQTGTGFFEFDNLIPGEYLYNVREQSGCEIVASDALVVGVDCGTGCGSLVASARDFEDATCATEPNGKAVIDVLGGSSPYEYAVDGVSWTPFISGNVIEFLPPDGTYNIAIRQDADNADCRTTVSVTINGPDEIVLETPIITTQKASCNQFDGVVKIGRVVGGTGSYTYQIDEQFVTLPADSIIDELKAGMHTFSVIDEVACQADFTFEVESPGVVIATIVDIPVNCDAIDQKAGLRIEIDFGLTTLPGPYSAAIAKTNDPDNITVYEIPDNGILTVLGLDKDFYTVDVSSGTDGGCTYTESVGVFGGAYPVAFEIIDYDTIVSCVDDLGYITIGNVTGDPDTTFIVQLLSGSSEILETYQVDILAFEGGFTIDESNSDKIVAGNYFVRIIQNQDDCAGVAIVSDLIVIAEPTGVLGFEVLSDAVSVADRPTGNISGEVLPSGGNPYEARIQLIEPLLELNLAEIRAFNARRKWDVVPPSTDDLNRYPHVFDTLWAGTYEIGVRDIYGCEYYMEHSIGYDENIFIPNIFTPNGDGFNDTFYIRNLPESGTQIVITNRSGFVVFQSDDYNLDNFWDGGDVADGVYYYNVKTVNGESYKGWVEKWSAVRP
jgi:gliding motility-associated-like protein